MNQLSREVADFIVKTQYEDLPVHVIETAKKSLLDAIGVMLAATTLGDGCAPMLKLAVANGGHEESTILGIGAKRPAHMAAFANGALAHAMDFEDTHDKAFVHSNAAAIPAALAVAEASGQVSGKELITAIALGSELVCRLGLSIKDNLLEAGWYMPPVFGAFGAAAAAGKVLGLSTEQMLDAISLTLCQATCSAELTQNPQSVIRSIRDAFAAQSGVLSAQLAKEGVTGFQQPFEGRLGFFHAYAKGNYDAEAMTANLGAVYEMANVSFKAWPSCRGTHPYIEGALKIMQEHSVQVEDIEAIRTVVSPVNKMLCEPLEAKQRPSSPINAKFSIPYAIGVAIHHGTVSLDHFKSEVLEDSEVLSIAAMVTYEIDHSMSLKDTLRGFTEIHTKDQVFSTVIETPYGDPTHPLGLDDLIAKFKACARLAMIPRSDEQLSHIVDGVLNLDSVKDIHELTALL
ncbi:MmgE/PrpD family protein [Paenibacillus sp. FSL W8-0186]|uniref:MmgE/PrpD family protein n=1 Tax=Paenibacillus sp. FSL W8-0186 TaxID=2921709 RepID=UPI0030CE3501